MFIQLSSTPYFSPGHPRPPLKWQQAPTGGPAPQFENHWYRGLHLTNQTDMVHVFINIHKFY